MVNIFAERAGVSNLLRGNAWIHLGNESFLKLWVKSGSKFEKQNSVLKKVDGKANWWRQYKLPAGLNYNNLKSSSQLISTNNYVDNTYNSETFSVTGQVYKNVLDSDFSNLELLKSKATNHSIWDSYGGNTKYYLSKNNYNAMLESFDGGKTWTNFKLIDDQIGRTPYKDEAFSGNGVGSGIQLKNQKDSKLNGRIIFPMYSFTNGVQSPYIIYSDDNGTTWNLEYLKNFKTNLMEGSFVETEDGELYLYLRQAIWGNRNNRSVVTKSLDGGITWISPKNNGTNPKYQDINLPVDGNVFSSLAYFKIKDKKYFAFSLPKNNYRQAGSLYITNEKFEKFDEIYTFDNKNQEHFAYSYPFTLEVGEDYADILVAYEWSPKTKIFDKDTFNNNRPKGGGIQLDKIRITIK